MKRIPDYVHIAGEVMLIHRFCTRLEARLGDCPEKDRIMDIVNNVRGELLDEVGRSAQKGRGR